MSLKYLTCVVYMFLKIASFRTLPCKTHVKHVQHENLKFTTNANEDLQDLDSDLCEQCKFHNFSSE